MSATQRCLLTSIRRIFTLAGGIAPCRCSPQRLKVAATKNGRKSPPWRAAPVPGPCRSPARAHVQTTTLGYLHARGTPNSSGLPLMPLSRRPQLHFQTRHSAPKTDSADFGALFRPRDAPFDLTCM